MKHKEHCYHTDPEAVEHGAPCICNEPPTTHTAMCHEYWDRGLNCMCIPPEENKRIASALKRGESIDDVIDPGWGPN